MISKNLSDASRYELKVTTHKQESATPAKRARRSRRNQPSEEQPKERTFKGTFDLGVKNGVPYMVEANPYYDSTAVLRAEFDCIEQCWTLHPIWIRGLHSSSVKQKLRSSQYFEKIPFLVVGQSGEGEADKRACLNIGDAFRLGESLYYVEETCEEEPPYEQIPCNSTQNSSEQCVICLETRTEQYPRRFGDHLVNVCACSGSAKYTHIRCLCEYIRSKYHSKLFEEAKVTGLKSFVQLNFLNQYECSVCKTSFSDKLMLRDGKSVSLRYLMVSELMASPVASFSSIDEKLYMVSTPEWKHTIIGATADWSMKGIGQYEGYLSRGGKKLYIQDETGKGTYVVIRQPMKLTKPKCKIVIDGYNFVLETKAVGSSVGETKSYLQKRHSESTEPPLLWNPHAQMPTFFSPYLNEDLTSLLKTVSKTGISPFNSSC
eukprot:TRINITY_DN13638_c0_g1_i2.p1 TRINITY_DN13638_c0_g1~~TRINITY_DN13638_c0_g1_i2.p1  ORF type:complete len:432 (+),score=20.65 TRINITY_DN13638_c0_g1_i2:64-1359(+)